MLLHLELLHLLCDLVHLLLLLGHAHSRCLVLLVVVGVDWHALGSEGSVLRTGGVQRHDVVFERGLHAQQRLLILHWPRRWEVGQQVHRA